MKKLLIFILGIFFGLSAFCSAEIFKFTLVANASLDYNSNLSYFTLSVPDGVTYSVTGIFLNSCLDTFPDDYVSTVLSGFNNNNFSYSQYETFMSNRVRGYLVSFDPIIVNSSNPLIIPYTFYNGCSVRAPRFNRNYYFYGFDFLYNNSSVSQSPIYGVSFSIIDSSISSSDITVFYNNGLSTSVACNGDNIITIDGLSTMSSISTFTPYFNINYTDQNNQILTESYSNNILYLSGGQYLKTYTGGSNNDWVLNLQSNGDNGFTGYLPTFNVTGNITDIDTGNVFNNFAENSLTVLLSNIPNYIQYVIMFALLLFVLGIFRKLSK